MRGNRMKVTREDDKVSAMMISGNTIILVDQSLIGVDEKYFKGVVISSDGVFEIGEFGDDWEISEFTPYAGSITLSND